MPRIRLEFLDGLRGLTAFYVLVYHLVTVLTVQWGVVYPPAVQSVVSWMMPAHAAVAIFIVLSGYCLMLPVAKASDKQLRGGFGEYLRRRARRILPPYYAALVLSLLAIGVAMLLQRHEGGDQKTYQEAFSAGSVLSHLFLVHNLNVDWANRINGPMWSVATEWQIYFVFALLLLPVWRKFGNGAVLVVAYGLGLAPTLLLPPEKSFYWAYPYFLGLFALGMVGATVPFTSVREQETWRERVPWGTLSALLFALYYLLLGLGKLEPLWLSETLVGVIAVCLILHCTLSATRQETSKTNWVRRFLESRSMAALGGFSYSLYLTQHIVMQAMAMLGRKLHASPIAALTLNLAIGIPVALVFAYTMSWFFERPFLAQKKPSA